MHGFHTSRQKALSLLMILVMMALPFLSMSPVSAHLKTHTSQHTSHSFHNAVNQAMGSKHDCCDPAQQRLMKDCCKHHCQHGEQCHCDAGQLGSSVALTMVTVLPEAIPAMVYHPVNSSSFRTKDPDSVFRPPISFL